MLLHTKLCSLINPLKNLAITQTNTIVHTNLFKLHTLHFTHINVIGVHIVINKLKMILPVVRHAIANYAQEGVNFLISQLLISHHMKRQRTFMPSKAILILLFNTCKSVNCPSPSFGNAYELKHYPS